MKIAVRESYSVTALARLHADPKVKLVEDFAQAEILLIRSQTQIDEHLLNQAPHLKLIVTATSGFDHIDWRLCQTRGILAVHTPEANAASTAELTLTLMLAWERQLFAATKNVRENLWRQGLARPEGLSGRSLGIVGLGRVGRRVAKLAQAFGMKISAFDPYVEPDVFQNAGAERLSFIELLKANDYVSLHVPLTKETRHLLNNPTFGEMQGEGVLINTCRGPVVDENALLLALDEGTIAGAAMDVIEREPPAHGQRIVKHPRLILTPHIGAFSTSAWEKASHEAVGKALGFVHGQKPADGLPLDVPWFEKT